MKPSAAKPFSKIGIASFVFSVLSIGAIGLMFMFLIFGGKMRFDAAFASFMMAIGSSITAFLLGVFVFFQKKTKRVFGILGFTFGFLEIAAIALSIVIFTKFLEALGKALGSGFGKM